MNDTASHRLEVLDLIRGFALGGIMFANVLWFNGFHELRIADRAAMLTGPADHIVLFLIRVLVNAKFYHIFAFLFGLGFALQIQRQRPGMEAMFARRMALLFVFGLVHSLLWWGDILRYYALLGITLLLFRGLSNRTLLIWIVTCSLLPLLSEPARALLGLDSNSIAGMSPRAWLNAVSQASLNELFGLNLRRIGDRFIETLVDGRLFKILAMFLVGMLAGRLSVFSQPQSHAQRIQRVLLPSLCIGIVGNLLYASLYYERWGLDRSTVRLLRDIIGLLAIPALSLFFVSALLHVSLQPQRWPRLGVALQHLAPVGRMALTNYVMQTLIAVLVFWPALGGQYARLDIAWCGALVVLVFTAQLWFSRTWLARYRFGPLEWLWRSGTYGQWQPLRR